MRISIILALTAIIFLSSCRVALAFENDIGFSKLDPSSPIYFLKVIRENLEMKTAVTERVKLLRYLEFATRRLREARTLIGKDISLISPTLEKYSYFLKLLPEKGLTDGEVTTRIKESLIIHIETLEQMYIQLPDLSAKMAVLATLNKIVGRIDIPNYARLPVCNLFSKEATSSALNQTEQFVLSARAKSCLGYL